MSLEQAIRDLQIQRDFLLANTWVNHPPSKLGEGCLILRAYPGKPEDIDFADRLEYEPRELLREVLMGRPGFSSTTSVGAWNDTKCSGPGEAIDVLEQAIALGKQRLADGA